MHRRRNRKRHPHGPLTYIGPQCGPLAQAAGEGSRPIDSATYQGSGQRAKRQPSSPRDDSRPWDAPLGRRNRPACSLHFPETFCGVSLMI
ncbi:hypothetical protein MRX96_020508 [Rhipicephalus microplus]